MSWRAVLVIALASGCSSTTLELEANDPASPNAPVATKTPGAHALAKDFDPFAGASEAKPASSVWSCPMHPEIQRPGPGKCPICGMTLEPKPAHQHEGHGAP